MLRSNYDFEGWNDGYNVGSKTLDVQRRGIVEQFHKTLNTLTDREPINYTRKTYDKLIDCIRIYIYAEERLIHKVDHRDFSHHQREHNILMNEAITFRNNLNNDVDRATLRADARFLWSLIVGHLTLSDMSIHNHLPHFANER